MQSEQKPKDSVFNAITVWAPKLLSMANTKINAVPLFLRPPKNVKIKVPFAHFQF